MLSVIIPTEGIEQPPSRRWRRWCRGLPPASSARCLLVDRADNGVIERVADVAGCRFLRFEDRAPRRLRPARSRPARPG